MAWKYCPVFAQHHSSRRLLRSILFQSLTCSRIGRFRITCVIQDLLELRCHHQLDSLAQHRMVSLDISPQAEKKVPFPTVTAKVQALAISTSSSILRTAKLTRNKGSGHFNVCAGRGISESVARLLTQGFQKTCFYRAIKVTSPSRRPSRWLHNCESFLKAETFHNSCGKHLAETTTRHCKAAVNNSYRINQENREMPV